MLPVSGDLSQWETINRQEIYASSVITQPFRGLQPALVRLGAPYTTAEKEGEVKPLKPALHSGPSLQPLFSLHVFLLCGPDDSVSAWQQAILARFEAA